MERKTFGDAPCSIARSLDVLGDWWSPLIIRECLYGVHRFDGFQQWLGIGRNILTSRLKLLIDQGLIEKRRYQDKPKRYEYHLTEKGYDAALALIALMPFGETRSRSSSTIGVPAGACGRSWSMPTPVWQLTRGICTPGPVRHSRMTRKFAPGVFPSSMRPGWGRAIRTRGD
jgi:DNA-binding HxlR family transcriptional regulator